MVVDRIPTQTCLDAKGSFPLLLVHFLEKKISNICQALHGSDLFLETLLRDHDCDPHFTDDKTDSQRFYRFPKVTQHSGIRSGFKIGSFCLQALLLSMILYVCNDN